MKVEVSTPSRLHFGLIDLVGDLGRVFGSVGVAIEKPRFVLHARESGSLEVVGGDWRRVRSAATRFLSYFKLDKRCRLEVKSTIPHHVGLGSGTQLALAVAASLSKIYHLPFEVERMAKIMGRVSISNVGIAAFDRGGFIVDGGYPADKRGLRKVKRDSAAPIIFRQIFPENWVFVVVVPDIGRGLSGARERRAFRTMPKVDVDLVEKICRLILVKMLPSVVEEDIENFGEALTQIQLLTGRCFEKIQGGIFGEKVIEELVKYLLKEGAYGAGQSSWGPATYGLVAGERAARRLKSSVETFLEDFGGGSVFTTHADNLGAKIEGIR